MVVDSMMNFDAKRLTGITGLAVGAAALVVAGCGTLGGSASPAASTPPAATAAPANGSAPTPGQQAPGQPAPDGVTSLPQWNVCYPNGTGSMPPCPEPLPGERGYEPSVMVPDEDGSGIFRNLHWTSWTSSSATATGTEWVSNCHPACGDGTMIAYRASVTLDQPVTYDGQLYFNRLTIYYPGQTPIASHHTEVQTPLVG
jgi:hypothetical protein